MGHSMTIRGFGLPAVTLALALMAAGGCEQEDRRQAREITEAVGDMKVVVDGNNQFAVDLHQVAADGGGNVFFSPFSINAAMSMVYGGAEGDTEQQIADALHADLDEAAWHSNLGALFDDLSGEKYRGYTLYSGNAVWGQQDENFKGDYLAILEDSYMAPLESVDFVGDPDGVLQEINSWVSEATKGHIGELFKAGDITIDTRLVLSNAIYFKADWLEKFGDTSTQNQDFFLPDGGAVTAEMMHRSGNIRVGVLEALKVLELPYVDDELSMVVVLPNEIDGLDEIETGLTAEQLDGWIAEASSHKCTLALPKFEMKLELPLKETLQELGIVDGFDPELADFTGVIDREQMEGNWFLHEARHEAFVLVDESGTEAAAATGVSGGPLTESIQESVSFIADHPFLFLIRDQLTGAILFMGRIEDPTAL